MQHMAWDALEGEARALASARATAREEDAVEAYLLSAAQAHGQHKLDLLRRAAQRLLLRGQVERALSVLRELSQEIDLPLPESSPAIHLQLALSQLHLRLRGFMRASPTRALPSALQLETMRTLATGLAEPAPGQALSSALCYLNLALDADDSLHVVRALGLSAALSGAADLDSRWAARALARMVTAAQADASAEAQGFASLIHGWVCHNHDEYAAAREHAARASSLLRECSGVEWELDQARVLEQVSACAVGAFADCARQTPALVDEALCHARVLSAAKLAGSCGFAAWLAPADPEGYRRALAVLRQHLPRSSRSSAASHWLVIGEATLALYEGTPEVGYALLERAHHAQPSFIHNQRRAQLALHTLRHGQCAASALSQLPAGHASSRRSRLREEIEQSGRVLERLGGPARTSAAECLRAALALDAGLWLEAAYRLAAALQLQAAAGLALSAAATRRRLGQLTGGAAGRRLVTDTEASMRAQGIHNVEAMTELLCPGLRC